MNSRMAKHGLLLVMSVLLSQASLAIEVGDGYVGYVSDKKATSLGDTLTLLVIESSSASTANGKTSGRDYSLAAGYDSPNSQNDASVGVTYNNDADKGRQHSGSVSAAITVAVVEKSPNGMMKVQGDQEIIVDGEKQLITVSGWARPADISRDNTLISTRLSEAFIEYTGFKNKKGFWGRIVSWFKRETSND